MSLLSGMQELRCVDGKMLRLIAFFGTRFYYTHANNTDGTLSRISVQILNAWLPSYDKSRSEQCVAGSLEVARHKWIKKNG